MHEHDFELIAAIAEGSLVADGGASVRGCPTCQEELSFQREALAALAAAPVPVMSELERARLHRAIEQALPGTRTSRVPVAPWYQRLVPIMAVAAALLVVVGLGSVLTKGAAEPTAERSALDAGGEGDAVATEQGDPELSTTAAASETTTTVAFAPPLGAEAPSAPFPLDFGAISDEELHALVRSFLAESAASEGPVGYLEDEAANTGMHCVEPSTRKAPGDELIGTARATVDGRDVEVYFVPEVAYVFDASSCVLTATID